MQSLRDTIPKLLRQLAGEDEAARLLFLQELWDQVVGERLAGCTRPLKLESGELVLEVPDEVWKEHLFQLRHDLRRSVNRLFGDTAIERIDLQVRLRERRD